MKFPLKIIERTREKVGPDFPLSFRFSADEFVPGGNTLEDSTKIAQYLENAGIDVLHVSAGIYESMPRILEPMRFKEGWRTYLAAEIKKVVKIPVITVGQIRSPEVAEQAALALGQSHEAEAFEILRESWETNVAPDFRRMLIVPISLLRRDDAFDFLIEVIGSSGPKLASEAATALAVYADDRSRRKVRDAVKRRDDPAVTAAFTREFGAMD